MEMGYILIAFHNLRKLSAFTALAALYNQVILLATCVYHLFPNMKMLLCLQVPKEKHHLSNLQGSSVMSYPIY